MESELSRGGDDIGMSCFGSFTAFIRACRVRPRGTGQIRMICAVTTRRSPGAPPPPHPPPPPTLHHPTPTPFPRRAGGDDRPAHRAREADPFGIGAGL